MMIGKLAFAAGLFIASSVGGVALGSYTIGGFRIDQPTDTIGTLAALQAGPTSEESAPPPVTLATAEQPHVCTGCDAKLYPEREWRDEPAAYAQEASYQGYQDDDMQPSRQDYPDDESWDAAVTAYWDDRLADDGQVSLAAR